MKMYCFAYLNISHIQIRAGPMVFGYVRVYCIESLAILFLLLSCIICTSYCSCGVPGAAGQAGSTPPSHPPRVHLLRPNHSHVCGLLSWYFQIVHQCSKLQQYVSLRRGGQDRNLDLKLCCTSFETAPACALSLAFSSPPNPRCPISVLFWLSMSPTTPHSMKGCRHWCPMHSDTLLLWWHWLWCLLQQESGTELCLGYSELPLIWTPEI